MKKALLTLLIPALFSCSGGGSDSGQPGPSGPGPVAPPAPPAPEPLILTEPPAGPLNFIFLIDPDMPPEMVSSIRQAEATIEGLMTAPIGKFYSQYADCGPDDLNVKQIHGMDPRADDSILISVSYGLPSDTQGDPLAVASVCNSWDDIYRSGYIHLSPDLMDYDRGVQTDTVFHEIMHAIGFGLSRDWWEKMNKNTDTGKAFSLTPFAKNEYEKIGGGTNGVPLSRDWFHWSDTVMEDEIMNPYATANGKRSPISSVTLGALRDLGYPVDMSKAQPYTLKIKGQSLPKLGRLIDGGHQHYQKPDTNPENHGGHTH